MSLPRDDLLNPLPGNSKGEDLEYDPVYDKIKEARLEEDDDTNQGEWQRARKKADVSAVIKLAGSALATRTKDLQIAAWLAEALVRKEGFAALSDCFGLLRELQARFWDSLYPQLEDGNPQIRASSQEWFAGRCDYLVRRIPITKKGLNWLNYYDAHDTTRERLAMSGTGSDDQKRAARDQAVALRENAAKEFKQAFDDTAKEFYAFAVSQVEGAQAALAELETFCEERYRKFAPNFIRLRETLEEIRLVINDLLNKKREKEPDKVLQSAARGPVETAAPEKDSSASGGRAGKSLSQDASLLAAKPASTEEAYAAIGRAAEYLRRLDPASVAPYLLVRSLRWAELRASGDNLDPSLLVAPPTQLRQSVYRMFLDHKWEELLSATEAATALPCARAWLDLHHYACVALKEQCYSVVAKAICSELRALIADFPTLPESILDDGTAVAGSETMTWLKEHIIPSRQPEPEPMRYIPANGEGAAQDQGATNGKADPFETALKLARSQHFGEAIELLSRQRLPGGSGRERFLRQLQISQLCLATGQFGIAYPILLDLFSEIGERKLLEWESTGFLVEPLSLLVRCIDKTNQGADQRAEIYNLLCRLEPAEALKLQRA